jgi:hypothetical protein
MHVKMTRIESGVTVPKGLFTLYANDKVAIVRGGRKDWRWH